MDRIELTPAQMRTIMQALFDSDRDDAADLHDELSGSFSRGAEMEHGENSAQIIVREH